MLRLLDRSGTDQDPESATSSITQKLKLVMVLELFLFLGQFISGGRVIVLFSLVQKCLHTLMLLGHKVVRRHYLENCTSWQRAGVRLNQKT